jgi:hypothetical protein
MAPTSTSDHAATSVAQREIDRHRSPATLLTSAGVIDAIRAASRNRNQRSNRRFDAPALKSSAGS